jgi:Peptidase A4 family
MKPNPALCLCATLFAAALASPPAAAQTNESSGWIKHRPMMPYLNRDGTFRRLKGETETSNWSGYAVTTGSPYTTASATWRVPSVTYDGGATPYGYEYVFNWVGIGGFSDATLIQLGTESIVSTSGATFYFAWYELYPGYDVEIALNVNPGDIITASLQCTAACTAGQTQTWQLTMADQTAKSAWTQNFQYQSSMGSAEWITEPPYYDPPGILPLADYDQATYDPVAANGVNPNLSLTANGIIAADPYGETSNPSAPVSGDVFSTCWGGNGAGLTPCVAASSPAPATDPPPPPPPPPANNVTVTLAATPAMTVTLGEASKLTWTSTNATTCAGNGFAIGNSGKYVTGPFAWALAFPRVTTSYSITCSGAGGDSATSIDGQIGAESQRVAWAGGPRRSRAQSEGRGPVVAPFCCTGIAESGQTPPRADRPKLFPCSRRARSRSGEHDLSVGHCDRHMSHSERFGCLSCGEQKSLDD